MAICIKCGAQKLRAWAPCQKCQYRPIEVNDLSLSIFLCDHIKPAEELREAGEQIKKGTFSFDPAEKEPIVADLEKDPVLLKKIQHPEEFKPNIFWGFIPWIIEAALLAWIAYLFWKYLK